MEVSKFEVGQVVYLKSDLCYQFPMTIREIDFKIIKVCWLDQRGQPKYDGFMVEMIREKEKTDIK